MLRTTIGNHRCKEPKESERKLNLVDNERLKERSRERESERLTDWLRSDSA